MNIKENKNIYRIINILKYAIILCAILKTQSVYTFFKEIDLHINMILVLLLSTMTVLRWKNNEFVINNKRGIIFLIIYIVYVLIYALLAKCIDRTFFVNFVIIFGLFFINLAFSFDVKKEIKNITKVFVNIMVVITVVSLFFFVFGSILKWIKPSNKIMINWGEERLIDSYFCIHFNTQTIEVLKNTIYRNSSIFTEAPMFALNLSFALATEIFLNDKKKTNNVIILIIGLISTLTLSAFVNIFLVYVLWAIINYKYIILDKKKVILNIILLIITILFLFVFWGFRSNSASLSIRIDDYQASFKAFSNHAIIGNGYNNELAIKEYFSDFRKYNNGLSNSIFVILAEGGIYLSLIYILPQILIAYESIKFKEKNILAMDIIFIISMFISIYTFTPLMFLNLAIIDAYIYSKKNKVEEENYIERMEL